MGLTVFSKVDIARYEKEFVIKCIIVKSQNVENHDLKKSDWIITKLFERKFIVFLAKFLHYRCRAQISNPHHLAFSRCLHKCHSKPYLLFLIHKRHM